MSEIERKKKWEEENIQEVNSRYKTVNQERIQKEEYGKKIH